MSISNELNHCNVEKQNLIYSYLINNQMSQFYLEENVQNVISAIIIKSPKLQTDLLYLRTVFLDSSKSLMSKIDKLTNKYKKAKQKIKLHSAEHTQFTFPSTDPNLLPQKIKHQRLRSHLNTQKTPQINEVSYDYSPDLMSLILTQAKSIKTIFDSVIKGYPESSNQISSSKLQNLYSVYKEFYKSFKQKHKEYVQNYSYDEKHIHKHSTTMKQRLLEQLKAETQKRKQLEQKLEALEEMMERSLLHKDKQLQKLNLRLVSLMNKNLTEGKRIFFCENCNDQMVVKEDKSHLASLQKCKINNQNQGNILGSVSRQKQGQFYKTSNKQRKNNLIVSSQKYLQEGSHGSSQFSSEVYSSEDEQICRSSELKIKTKKSNIGRFYSGNETFITGKINQTQSEINDSSKTNIHAKKNNEKQPLQKHLLKNSQNHSQRITFGSKPEALVNQAQPQQQQLNGLKRQSFEQLGKVLQDQIDSLKQNLRIEKQEKQVLKKKVEENQTQYKKLENEVNQLYKLINESKGNQSWTYQSAQTNQDNFNQKKWAQTYQNKQQFPNQQIKIKLQKESSENIKNSGKIFYLDKDFGSISPIKEVPINSKDKQIKTSLSPIKNHEQKNQSEPRTKILKEVKEAGVNVNIQNLDGKLGGFYQKNPNSLKSTAHFGQALSIERQNDRKIKAQKLQQIWEGQYMQKDELTSESKTRPEKRKLQADELMMMLLLQAFSIQQFLKEKEQEQNDLNFRNYYAKDYVEG